MDERMEMDGRKTTSTYAFVNVAEEGYAKDSLIQKLRVV